MPRTPTPSDLPATEQRVTKRALISAIAERVGTTYSETERFYQALIETVLDTALSGRTVQMTGFGNFKIIHRKGHFANLGQVAVPPHDVLRFVPAADLKDYLALPADERASTRTPGTRKNAA